jgi:competence protein ComEC
MPAAPEAMYLAMLLGDQGRVTLEMRQQFSRTGTSHLLAISGLHLGALAGLSYLVVFWLLCRFSWLLLRVNAMKVAALAAALPVVAYAHLAGGSPATQRAEIMVLAYLLMVLLGRPREVWSALVLAALVILLLNPLLLFSVSFQLSFAAVAGLLYFVPRWLGSAAKPAAPGELRPGWPRRFGKRLTEALAVSAAASLVTAPLVAHYFQIVSLFGFLVNLVVIPLVLMLALPLGGLAVLAELLTLTPLAKIFLNIGQFPLTLGYAIIAGVAGLPGSGVTVPPPSWLQVGLMYAWLFLVFPLRRSRLTWAGAGLVAVMLTATVVFPLMGTPQAGEMTVLDSNAGLDAVLVSPEGHRMAVTAAWEVWPGRQAGGLGALPGYLHWRQFRRLDAVLALNLNVRNAPELLALAQQFEIGGFWWEGRRPEGRVLDLINWLGDSGRPGLSLTKMNPPKNLGSMTLAYLGLGEGQGVALRVTCRGRQALILPPLKRAVWESAPDLEENSLTVLVAPGEAPAVVVDRLKPGKVILYGSKIREAGKGDASRPPIYQTRRGTVTVTFSEQGATCNQWRP